LIAVLIFKFSVGTQNITFLQNFLVRNIGKKIIPEDSNYKNYSQTNDNSHAKKRPSMSCYV